MRPSLVGVLVAISVPAYACDSESFALFACEAANGRKFIELCAPSPFAAVYTHQGVYTQSVRFVTGNFAYTVFTHARGMQELDSGVEVRNRKTGKASIVKCSERPRFYIFELKGLVSCDPETPVGMACVK